MTDIVERLRRERSSPIPKGLAFEAADEIERLRAEVVLKDGEEFRLRTITAALGAEIEQLRAELSNLPEIERLQGALKLQYQEIIEHLRAELDALRALQRRQVSA